MWGRLDRAVVGSRHSFCSSAVGKTSLGQQGLSRILERQEELRPGPEQVLESPSTDHFTRHEGKECVMAYLFPPCASQPGSFPYRTDKVRREWNKDTLTHGSPVRVHPLQRELLGAPATHHSEGHQPGNHFRPLVASSKIKTKTLDMKETA